MMLKDVMFSRFRSEFAVRGSCHEYSFKGRTRFIFTKTCRLNVAHKLKHRILDSWKTLKIGKNLQRMFSKVIRSNILIKKNGMCVKEQLSMFFTHAHQRLRMVLRSVPSGRSMPRMRSIRSISDTTYAVSLALRQFDTNALPREVSDGRKKKI